jgi:CheY-like chemotaxis protein
MGGGMKDRKVVLVVDDEEMVEQMIELFLEKRGYQTVSFKHSQDALEFFRSHADTIDLVITDHKMPGLSGAELSRRLFTISCDTPVIMITGFLENAVRAPNVKKVLNKPVLRKELLQAVEELVGPPVEATPPQTFESLSPTGKSRSPVRRILYVRSASQVALLLAACRDSQHCYHCFARHISDRELTHVG